MKPAHIRTLESELPPRGSGYPEKFQPIVKGRMKRRIGDHFGLKNFGVNVTRLLPGAATALRHAHTLSDEFVYVVEGRPTLITNEGETAMEPGMCVGFAHGDGNAHHLVNRTDADVLLLEVGDRTPGDGASYPDDDLVVAMVNGVYEYTRKDGTKY
jgi:uncharacterized cupin superfamily protein